ncbi:PcfJ domain-containing protein, partial [Lichenifustis flavocetrariae]
MRRHVDNPGFLLGWAIEKLRTPTYVPEIARLAEELGDSFNTDWSEKAARRACETARREALERHQRTLSSDTGSPIWAKSLDVSPFPTIATIGPYAFLALETLGSLESEGRSMHHCVGSYGNRATFKTSRLFSVL